MRDSSRSNQTDRTTISWSLASSLGAYGEGKSEDVEAASAAEAMEIVAPETRMAVEAETTVAVVRMEVVVCG